ncbi:unnamed protein product [Ectocarpus sp. 12 AP-2014]
MFMKTEEMSFPVRGCENSLSRPPFSHHEISKNVSDLDMGAWISSLLRETLQGADFADGDFMGRSGEIVSIPD